MLIMFWNVKTVGFVTSSRLHVIPRRGRHQLLIPLIIYLIHGCQIQFSVYCSLILIQINLKALSTYMTLDWPERPFRWHCASCSASARRCLALRWADYRGREVYGRWAHLQCSTYLSRGARDMWPVQSRCGPGLAGSAEGNSHSTLHNTHTGQQWGHSNYVTTQPNTGMFQCTKWNITINSKLVNYPEY